MLLIIVYRIGQVNIYLVFTAPFGMIVFEYIQETIKRSLLSKTVCWKALNLSFLERELNFDLLKLSERWEFQLIRRP